jgi:hypothetical protein
MSRRCKILLRAAVRFEGQNQLSEPTQCLTYFLIFKDVLNRSYYLGIVVV